MVASVFVEVISIGAVLPFLGILISPEKVFKQPIIADLAHALGIASASELVLPLTVAFAAAAVIAGAMRMLVLWIITRLSFAAGVDLSLEVYRRTLYQPYRVHVSRNSSEVINAIVNKVGANIHVLIQSLTLISSMALLVAVVVALLAVDAAVASLASLGFGLCYAVITWWSRKRLRANGRRIADQQTYLLKALNEGLGGIRDVLLDGTQELYSEIYKRADMSVRRAQGENLFIAGSPRFAVESLAIVLIAVLAYGVNRQSGGIFAAIPVLGAFAIGAQRLLPALQQSYSAWSNIVGSQASISDLLELLDQPMPADAGNGSVATALDFSNSICFDAVRFRYSNDGPWILAGLDLTIRKGARVGVVGSTGSGKSTAIDLLMGLLEPTEGRLIVDGQEINADNRRAWQQCIAHVPQAIYLADASLAANIAFGVRPELIDMQRVKRAASQAHIAEFVELQAEGYNTSVGERGVRLSGGQRQRIGIARALYKQASILVFDEATSALDNTTEQEVMEAIKDLDRAQTIILIAHRLTTVRHCDLLIELENGCVMAQGSYEQLLERSPSFRRLAESLS